MSEPVCAQQAPYVMEMEAGTYWWCACGKSKNQPFCDGSHKGSEFRPTQVVLDKKEKVAFCGCKRSKNAPRCDGSHKALAG
jgi:CDGSH-type Zn-finger protein